MNEQELTKLQITYGKFQVFFGEGFAPFPNYMARNAKKLGLTNTELRLMLIIFGYSGSNGLAFPSQQTLADNMEIPLRKLKEYIKTLFAKGFIEIINTFDEESGTQNTNIYNLEPALLKMEQLYISEKGITETVTKPRKLVTRNRIIKDVPGDVPGDTGNIPGDVPGDTGNIPGERKKADKPNKIWGDHSGHRINHRGDHSGHRGGDHSGHRGGDHNGATKRTGLKDHFKRPEEDKASQSSRVNLTHIEIESIENTLALEYSEMKHVSFKTVCAKVRRKHDNGKITKDYEEYLRAALEDKREKLAARRAQETTKSQQPKKPRKVTRTEHSPEWLEQQKRDEAEREAAAKEVAANRSKLEQLEEQRKMALELWEKYKNASAEQQLKEIDKKISALQNKTA